MELRLIHGKRIRDNIPKVIQREQFPVRIVVCEGKRMSPGCKTNL